MKEIFKDIPQYEGFYQVSNMGRVRSFHGKTPRIIRGKKARGGKTQIWLSNGVSGRLIQTHQLVAMAFLGHVPCGMKVVVDHIDNNPTNNRLDNLQLLSNRENCSKDRRRGSSKYIGVSWESRRSNWVSYIRIGKKKKYLGSFSDELSASIAYQKALSELNENEGMIP